MAGRKKLGRERDLTTREEEILNFIWDTILKEGFPPTVREIGKALHLHSTSTVHNYLNRLEDMGIIKRNPSHSRAIEIVSDAFRRTKKMIPVPMVSTYKSSLDAVPTEQQKMMYWLPSGLIGDSGNCFMCVMQGNNMANAGIQSGDYLIVSERDDVQDGDIVAASVGNGDMSVIRFYRETDGTVCLHSADEKESAISSKDTAIRIRGKVIGTYHRFI